MGGGASTRSSQGGERRGMRLRCSNWCNGVPIHSSGSGWCFQGPAAPTYGQQFRRQRRADPQVSCKYILLAPRFCEETASWRCVGLFLFVSI